MPFIKARSAAFYPHKGKPNQLNQALELIEASECCMMIYS
jgi:hypothetical protein